MCILPSKSIVVTAQTFLAKGVTVSSSEYISLAAIYLYIVHESRNFPICHTGWGIRNRFHVVGKFDILPCELLSTCKIVYPHDRVVENSSEHCIRQSAACFSCFRRRSASRLLACLHAHCPPLSKDTRSRETLKGVNTTLNAT